MVTLDGLSPTRFRKASFRIRNTGSRAAYVKALCFADLETKRVMERRIMTVSPEKFVLREGAHEVSIIPDYEQVLINLNYIPIDPIDFI